VQLASTDQHGADLGQLAEVARHAVRLGVDGEELGLRNWLVQQIHERPMQPRGPDGLQLVEVHARQDRDGDDRRADPVDD
jgi:hypothetical protein